MLVKQELHYQKEILQDAKKKKKNFEMEDAKKNDEEEKEVEEPDF